MSNVLKWIARAGFYIFLVAVVIWTASNTVGLIRRVLPGDDITPWFGLFLFDGGTIIWLLVFLYYGEGIGQRAVAIGMFALDAVGVVLAVLSELYLGGQQYADIPTWLGTAVIWIIGIQTAMNMGAGYIFHLLDPATREQIEVQTMRDEVKEMALRLGMENVRGIAVPVAKELSRSVRRDVLVALNIGDHFREAELTGTVAESAGTRANNTGIHADIGNPRSKHTGIVADTGNSSKQEHADTGNANPTRRRKAS